MLTQDRLKMIFFATLLALGVGAGQAAADEALWAALAEGGKVVMVRHTEAEEADPERSMHLSGGECSEEPNLTEEGRAQARRLAEAIEQHGIPVAGVLTSEFCRARETAELAFGEVEPWNALNLLNAMPAGDADFLMEDVRDRIGDFSGPGNLFMLTHRPNINTITFQNVEAGSLVILEADGTGMFEVLGVIPLEAYR